MEEKVVSVDEALESVIRTINAINVPVKYYDQISKPLAESTQVVQMCIDFLRDNAAKQDTEEKPEEEGEQVVMEH